MVSKAKLVSVLACFVSVSSLAENWKVLPDEVDPMSSVQSYYSASPVTTSLSQLRFPYSDVHSWVGVGCNSEGHYWSFIGFTDKNFTGGKRVYGEVEHYTKIKYDDELKTIHLIEADNGRNFLNVATADKRDFIKGVMTSNKIITGVQWYGHDDVWFEYSMKGSGNAINAIFEKCEITPLVNIEKTNEKLDSDLVDRALGNNGIELNSSTKLDDLMDASLLSPKNGDWTVQIASFKTSENALRLTRKLTQAGYSTYQTAKNNLFYVYVGSAVQREDVERFRVKMKKEFSLNGIVVRYSSD
ncbi:SPOR domain-containing protein [Bizionia paragorgiae]|uniref:SPOR domain-containing protein n=1 Tax=Bizionia paragorgiae TaxID=283786 RepID=UPI003A92C90F